MRHKLHGSRTGWAALALTLMAATAQADDAKLISGSICDFATSGSNVEYQKMNGFRNISGRPELVTCPIVKDRMGGPLTSVHVLTSPFGSSGNCRVKLRVADGGGISVFAPTNVQPLPSGNQYINWTTPIPANVTPIEVQCNVPNGHSVLSIQYAEPE